MLNIKLSEMTDDEKLKNDMVVGVDTKKVVDLPEWQEIRVSLLGKWKTDPKGNLEKLRKFLGNISTTSNRKLRIVHNYVTGSGFRLGIIKSPEIEKFQNEVRAEVAKRRENKTWK